MRKITFDVVIAMRFDDSQKFSIPIGVSMDKDIEVEFEPQGGDVMREAEEALRSYMNENYPTWNYRFYYWTWLS